MAFTALVLCMGSWLVVPLCCWPVLANILDALDAEGLYAVAEVLAPTVLAMELSRQSSK